MSRCARRETLLQFHEAREFWIRRESKAGLARQAEHLVVGGKRFAGKTAKARASRGANEPVEQEFSKPQAMELVCRTPTPAAPDMVILIPNNVCGWTPLETVI